MQDDNRQRSPSVTANHNGEFGTAWSSDDFRFLQSCVLDNMAEGVSISDEQGYILYTNSAEDRMFGYGRGELIGQHLSVQSAYSVEEDRARAAEILQQLQLVIFGKASSSTGKRTVLFSTLKRGLQQGSSKAVPAGSVFRRISPDEKPLKLLIAGLRRLWNLRVTR